MEINFIGGAYLDRSSNLNAQVCQNLYPIIDQEHGNKSVAALMNTPGLTLFCSLGSGKIRGFCVMGDYLYVTRGDKVYRVDKNGNYDLMTGILLTNATNLWMANNGTQVMIVDGVAGYILSGTTVTQIADADFPIPTSLTYQDGYFIISKKDTGRFYLSGSYDGTSWSALDYATAEGDPDNLQVVISSRSELWLLGKTSFEVWYNAGVGTPPFSRISGAFNHIGCSAPKSVAEFHGIVAGLDNNRYVMMTEGYNGKKISTPQIDYQIAQYTTVDDAVGFIYSQEGHTFYVLTFPSEDKTWCYDFTVGHWHTRASGVSDSRHRPNCYALFEGMHIVGDFENGNLYKYDLGVYSDDGTILRKIRSCQAVHGDRKLIFHSALEVEFESGVGLNVDDPDIGSGQDPQAVLQWSDDGGHVWSNEHWSPIGKIGKYNTRVRWKKLGSSRSRVYRVMVTDPVKTVMIGAHLDFSV